MKYSMAKGGKGEEGREGEDKVWLTRTQCGVIWHAAKAYSIEHRGMIQGACVHTQSGHIKHELIILARKSRAFFHHGHLAM